MASFQPQRNAFFYTENPQHAFPIFSNHIPNSSYHIRTQHALPQTKHTPTSHTITQKHPHAPISIFSKCLERKTRNGLIRQNNMLKFTVCTAHMPQPTNMHILSKFQPLKSTTTREIDQKPPKPLPCRTKHTFFRITLLDLKIQKSTFDQQSLITTTHSPPGLNYQAHKHPPITPTSFKIRKIPPTWNPLMAKMRVLRIAKWHIFGPWRPFQTS